MSSILTWIFVTSCVSGLISAISYYYLKTMSWGFMSPSEILLSLVYALSLLISCSLFLAGVVIFIFKIKKYYLSTGQVMTIIICALLLSITVAGIQWVLKEKKSRDQIETQLPVSQSKDINIPDDFIGQGSGIEQIIKKIVSYQTLSDQELSLVKKDLDKKFGNETFLSVAIGAGNVMAAEQMLLLGADVWVKTGKNKNENFFSVLTNRAAYLGQPETFKNVPRTEDTIGVHAEAENQMVIKLIEAYIRTERDVNVRVFSESKGALLVNDEYYEQETETPIAAILASTGPYEAMMRLIEAGADPWLEDTWNPPQTPQSLSIPPNNVMFNLAQGYLDETLPYLNILVQKKYFDNQSKSMLDNFFSVLYENNRSAIEPKKLKMLKDDIITDIKNRNPEHLE